MTVCATSCLLMSTKPWAESSHWLGWGWRRVGNRVGNHAFDASRPQPRTDGLHRIVESGDASAVSHGETGPFREPYHWCTVYDGTRQGTAGFLGHDRCQGQTCGSPARRHEALILMGGWCGAHTAD